MPLVKVLCPWIEVDGVRHSKGSVVQVSEQDATDLIAGFTAAAADPPPPTAAPTPAATPVPPPAEPTAPVATPASPPQDD